jgi:hypothetical protein
VTPPIAGVLVAAFLLLSVVTVAVLLQKLPARRKWLLLAAIVFSIAAKMSLASIAPNFDMTSWRIAADLQAQAQSVYANTDRYNYGPIWAWILSGLLWLTKLLHVDAGQGFHVIVALFLATVDALIAMTLAAAYSSTAAIVFLLSPITLLISGFHAQFDNLAILFALLAWLIIRGGTPGARALVASALLAGLSLAAKHFLFLFPVWLLFWKPLGKLRSRILYAAIAYGLFFCSFSPWWLDPASCSGILHNVFEYAGRYYGETLLRLIAHLLTQIFNLDAIFPWIPAGRGLQALWMVLLLVSGIVAARRGSHELFLRYIVVLYAFSPAFADQYMSIPMIACAVLYPLWPSWAFVASGTGLLLVSHYGVLGTYYYELFQGKASIAVLLLVYAQMYFMVLSEFSVAVLAVMNWRSRAVQGLLRSGSPAASNNQCVPCETSARIALP